MIYLTIDRSDGAKLFVDVDSEKLSATLTARIPGRQITTAVIVHGREQAIEYIESFRSGTGDAVYSAVRDAPTSRKFTVTEIGRKKVSETS